MDQTFDNDETESLRVEFSEIGRSFSSPLHPPDMSSRCDSGLSSSIDGILNEETVLQWAAIDRLPTIDRVRSSLFGEVGEDDNGHTGRKLVDVTNITATEKRMLIDKLIKHIEDDNLRLLRKMRRRTDRVGVDLPTIEVRCKDLAVEAQCRVVDGKPIRTLWSSLTSTLLDITRLPGLSHKAQINIISDVSCVIKPGRMTLLLGPPGCGKTTLLKALSGNLDNSLKVSGGISYNGYEFDEFVVQKTSAYISQEDVHMPEMTVRETLDFSALCQGIGSRAEILIDLTRKEKEAKIIPDLDIDTYIKAISVEGQRASLQTDYIMKILGLDICADTLIGDAMSRGISGGQKKRLTTGEMIVGPTKALFMDEISNGLDSSTTYQVICCLQQQAHMTDATVLVSLLQPAPEAFDLFDDIILMGEGKIVYHGARCDALEFFKSCGFSCPERKGVADFLQEVISRKDQEQYWQESQKPYNYISIDMFSKMFKDSNHGKKLSEELSLPFDKSKGDALIFSVYSLPKWTLLRACMSREILLLKRNSFVHIFKSVQLVIVAMITMTLFLRTQMGIDVVRANNYFGAIYFSLVTILFDGWAELAITVARLPVFYKQRELYFYPAWAYAIPATIVKIPLSLLVAVVWTSLTYYTIGYTPDPGRFFRQIIVLFAVHVVFSAMYRFIASVFRSMVAATVAVSFVLTFFMLFSGFYIPRTSMPIWLKWTFWISPLSYGIIGLSGNEFLAPRWQKELSGGTTLGMQALDDRGFNFGEHLFWISVAALFGFAMLFNVFFVLALSLLKAPGSLAFISSDKLSQLQRSKDPDVKCQDKEQSRVCPSTYTKSITGRMVLPCEPLNIVFENVQYYIETPVTMKERGFTQKRLKLLSDITGSFRPGVLTALMGVSGAGKTTLLDVLAGRKTSGIVEGEIRIGGYPKVQSTFARISGYCEQTDIHSPHVTVEESVIFSAWLRLDASIDPQKKYEFVQEVLETIELDEIKDSLVGVPGVDGLSTEQRKRLTIAVEFVANPSIILMDEPTTGLDARAAAIVMRAVKNVANTGRTVVCTIHQPSIDIFESFDELVLLKTGGSIIYSGPLGCDSSKVIEYFEGISGVPKIRDKYNPATWILEVTSNSCETELGIDFGQIYKNSSLQEVNKELVRMLSTPPPGSYDLQFPSRYSQNGWDQFKTCLWKQHWSYWRSPPYNLTRLTYTLFSVFFYGFLFWGQGKKIRNQQSLLTLLASVFTSVLTCGVTNSSTVLPYVSAEQIVFYREKFAGMYSSWAYSAAQVIIEIPYLFVQAVALTVITYPMIGFDWSAYKVLWFFYTTFCTLLYFTYLGMLLIPITPSFQVAAVLQTAFYTLFELFAGLYIPRSQIPKWWIWMYYLSPNSWTLNSILTSQFGDVQDEILAFGETKTVAAFLRDYFGYERNMLPLVGVMLILYPIVFASLFAHFIGKLNFLKR